LNLGVLNPLVVLAMEGGNPGSQLDGRQGNLKPSAWLTITTPLPLFFISVDSKRFSVRITRLESMFTKRLASVDSRELVRTWRDQNAGRFVNVANRRLKPKSMIQEAKKSESGDRRSRARARALPSEYTTLITTSCQGRNPQNREKRKRICETWGFAAGFRADKSLKFGQGSFSVYSDTMLENDDRICSSGISPPALSSSRQRFYVFENEERQDLYTTIPMAGCIHDQTNDSAPRTIRASFY
jgi:hypothetical protein